MTPAAPRRQDRANVAPFPVSRGARRRHSASPRARSVGSAQRLVETHWNDTSLGGIERRRQIGEPTARSLLFCLRITTDVRGRVSRVDFPVGIDARMGSQIVLQLTGRRHNIPRNVTREVRVEYFSKGGFQIG